MLVEVATLAGGDNCPCRCFHDRNWPCRFRNVAVCRVGLRENQGTEMLRDNLGWWNFADVDCVDCHGHERRGHDQHWPDRRIEARVEQRRIEEDERVLCRW